MLPVRNSILLSGLLKLCDLLSELHTHACTQFHFVESAYWAFLQHVYFSTDTENTRNAVRGANNGIWPDMDDYTGNIFAGE